MASLLKSKARPVRVEPGLIEVHLPATGLKEPKELAQELAATLKQLTEQPWEVTLAGSHNNTETYVETERRKKEDLMDKARQHPAVRPVLDAFPDAEVVDVLTDEN